MYLLENVCWLIRGGLNPVSQTSQNMPLTYTTSLPHIADHTPTLVHLQRQAKATFPWQLNTRGQRSQPPYAEKKPFNVEIGTERGSKREREWSLDKWWRDYSWFHHGFGPFTAPYKNLLACEWTGAQWREVSKAQEHWSTIRWAFYKLGVSGRAWCVSVFWGLCTTFIWILLPFHRTRDTNTPL